MGDWGERMAFFDVPFYTDIVSLACGTQEDCGIE